MLPIAVSGSNSNSEYPVASPKKHGSIQRSNRSRLERILKKMLQDKLVIEPKAIDKSPRLRRIIE